MFTLGRKKNKSENPDQTSQSATELPEKKEVKGSGSGFFHGLRNGLSRTRQQLTGGIGDLFQRGEKIDNRSLEELEDQLLTSDVGIEATELIVNGLRERLKQQKLSNGESLKTALRDQMLELLEPVNSPLEIPDGLDGPFVLLMVGINGAGKTTTIGKLAKRFQEQGLSVALAAGDTFRAAAVEQLQTWGERNNVTVIAQQGSSDNKVDPAAVIFDAVSSCRAKQIDILIADTAGRLHTQNHLMEELGKIRRVISKAQPDAPHEVMLVIDATTGQNALNQAEQFNVYSQLTGLTLTKLDGTAKGGVIFAMAQKLKLPIRYIGVGEQKEDLRTFNAGEFVDALLDMNSNDSA